MLYFYVLMFSILKPDIADKLLSIAKSPRDVAVAMQIYTFIQTRNIGYTCSKHSVNAYVNACLKLEYKFIIDELILVYHILLW